MSKTVLVVGENGLDEFFYGDVPRVAPEAPCLVFNPKQITRNPGLAKNVSENIRSLRPDWTVRFLGPFVPILKRRYVDSVSNQFLFRVDENDHVPNPLTFEYFKKWEQTNGQKPDVVVFSDYNKGYLTEEFLETALDFCTCEQNIPTLLDTKKLLGGWSSCAEIVKINLKEFLEHKNCEYPPNRYCHNLVVTRGPEGADIYYEGDNIPTRVNGYPTPIGCLAGAGDCVLAALTIKYLETNDLKQSVQYANAVAAIAVSKRGVVTVTQQEVGAFLSDNQCKHS